MNIFQLNKILLEYNQTGNLTTLTGLGGDKAGGKNLDKIATGVTKPYTQTQKKEPTENEKRFPNLAKMVKQMKDSAISGNKVVIGVALKELQLLVQTMNLRTDEDGETILPFGNDTRLTRNGNNFFIHLKSGSNSGNTTPQIHITKNPLDSI